MHFDKDDLIKLYNLFIVESKNFKLKPCISSFEEFEDLFISNKKITITHSCNNSFNLSLKEWIMLSDINNGNEGTYFMCIHCFDSEKLDFQNWKIKDKFCKFQEFKEHFNVIPNINSFEDYCTILKSNVKVQITHLKCNNSNTLSLKDWQFLNNKNKHFKDEELSHLCLDCVEKKNSAHVGWEWQRKYNRFKKASEGFIISPNISNAKDYIELYDKEVTVTHIKCGRSSSIVLQKWMSLHSINRNVIDEEKNHLCPFCGQEKRNIQYQETLDNKYNNEFILASDYNGSKSSLLLKHTICGGTFDIIPENYRNSFITCKCCGEKPSVLVKSEIAKMNEKLNIYLKKHNLTHFTPLSDSPGVSKPMKFRSEICGHEFERTARSLIPFGGKDYCPKCIDLRFKSSNQEDRNGYFQTKLDETHGANTYTLVSDYTGQNSDVKVIHNKCGNEIGAYSETIRKETYQCPYCEADNLKNSNYISLSQKMELYEKEAGYKYKILTPFVHLKETITVKHLVCGKTFKVTGNTFNEASKHEICPHCQKQARLKKALELLKKNHGDNYILLNPEDFISTTSPLKFKHKCGAVIDKTFASLRNANSEHCEKCSTTINSTAKLKSYTFKRFKGEYLVLGEYIKTSHPVKFRHKKCGKVFSMSPKDFQNRKVPCKHCNKESVSLNTKEVQRRANEKFGKLFKVCGQYKNSKTEMTIMCNNCSHIFPDKLTTFLARKKCPSCKKKHL